MASALSGNASLELALNWRVSACCTRSRSSKRKRGLRSGAMVRALTSCRRAAPGREHARPFVAHSSCIEMLLALHSPGLGEDETEAVPV